MKFPSRGLGARFALLVVPFLTMACAGDTEPAESPVPQDATVTGAAAGDSELTLVAAREVGLRNAAEPLPGLVTGGQPSPEEYSALVAAGADRFISLRPESEDGAGWESSTDGADFTRIPISGAGDLTRENVERLSALLDGVDGETVLYCASGNRVGALLALEAAWIDGAEPEAALELGLAAGLTRLEPAVRELLGLS